MSEKKAMLGCGVIVFFMFVNAILGAWLWPYSLNTWLVFLDKAPIVVWWHGVILGAIPFFGNITIPFAVTTWILMLFIA